MIRRALTNLARKLIRRNGLHIVPMWVLMNLIEFQIVRHGIWFSYKFDTVLWYFPWKRKERNGYKYATILTNGCFNSLAEIDKFWEEYENAFHQRTSNIDNDNNNTPIDNF